VLNLDDPMGVALAEKLKGRVQVIGYALNAVDAGLTAAKSWSRKTSGSMPPASASNCAE
jgi:hypothetical protein